MLRDLERDGFKTFYKLKMLLILHKRKSREDFVKIRNMRKKGE